MDIEDAGGGLRERKKRQTRIALSWAAIRLVVERGFDNVRVEDIAAAAGVSPRTFNNYFSSKGEAIVARHVERTRLMVAELRARPASMPLWDAITSATVAATGLGGPASDSRVPDQQWAAGVRLMMSEPVLQGEVRRAVAQAEAELADAIAERTGTDASRDLYPGLVAAVVTAAHMAAIRQWMRADPPAPIDDLLREALAAVAAGLPVP